MALSISQDLSAALRTADCFELTNILNERFGDGKNFNFAAELILVHSNLTLSSGAKLLPSRASRFTGVAWLLMQEAATPESVGYALTKRWQQRRQLTYNDIVIAYDPVNQGFKITQTDKDKVGVITATPGGTNGATIFQACDYQARSLDSSRYRARCPLNARRTS